MYLLEELVKEYQQVLLNEAKTARKFNQAEGNGSWLQNRWRVGLGNFLIASGLKLKGQYQNAGQAAPNRVSLPLS
jgi:hypothetical protein